MWRKELLLNKSHTNLYFIDLFSLCCAAAALKITALCGFRQLSYSRYKLVLNELKF